MVGESQGKKKKEKKSCLSLTSMKLTDLEQSS